MLFKRSLADALINVKNKYALINFSPNIFLSILLLTY